MYKIIYSPKSNLDINLIYQFIANDNLFYANKVIIEIKKTIYILKEHPLIGKKIDNEFREIIEPQYKFRIVYRLKSNIIQIVSVFKYRNSWE